MFILTMLVLQVALSSTCRTKDPSNPRRRLYKVFESFKHSSERLKKGILIPQLKTQSGTIDFRRAQQPMRFEHRCASCCPSEQSDAPSPV